MIFLLEYILAYINLISFTIFYSAFDVLDQKYIRFIEVLSTSADLLSLT